MRQEASDRRVRPFGSYREAELCGYYSIRRLGQMGLSVPDSIRPYYERMVATRHGNLPVFSRQQASPSHAIVPVREAEPSDPTGVEILLPRGTAEESAAPKASAGPAEKKRRTRGRARPQKTGYFIDTPEGLEIPESHKDVENEIRLILHIVKAGIDQHRHRVEGTAHYNHPLGKRLMGGRAESRAYKWLVENGVLICADHSYSHRPDDPAGSFSKSYCIHSRFGTWHKWEISKCRLAAKLLRAQSQRADLQSPKRQAVGIGAETPVPASSMVIAEVQTEQQQTPNVFGALCGLIRPVPELLTITTPITDHLVHWNLDLAVDWDKARRIMDQHPDRDRDKAMATARQVGDPEARHSVCDYGRFHSPITRLFSPLRQAVYFKSCPSSKTVGWDLRNSQILHLVKAYKEDRYKSRAGSRSQEPFFNKRELEFFKLVEKGQVYDFYFAKAQRECPDYLAAKIRRTAQRTAWEELWNKYLEELPVEGRPKDLKEQVAERRRLLRKCPVRSIAVQVHDPTRDDFKQVLFADVFYGRAVVDTPVTRLFEVHHPEILQWIRSQKAHDYADLARRMQREESGMMIGAVVRRLMEHHPEVPFYTVHDSITTVGEFGGLVGRILREEYERAGLHPALKEIGDS
jgi:hypothetical protein